MELLGIDSREHVVINEALLDPLDQASPTGLGPVEGAAQAVQFTLVDKHRAPIQAHFCSFPNGKNVSLLYQRQGPPNRVEIFDKAKPVTRQIKNARCQSQCDVSCRVLRVAWQIATGAIFVNNGREATMFWLQIALCVWIRMYWIHDDPVCQDGRQQGPLRFGSCLPYLHVPVDGLERLQIQLLRGLAVLGCFLQLELRHHHVIATENLLPLGYRSHIGFHSCAPP